jgi:hypothetical protein
MTLFDDCSRRQAALTEAISRREAREIECRRDLEAALDAVVVRAPARWWEVWRW